MVDSDHNTYTYKLSENDLIVERGGYSSVLRLDRLTKSELQFNSESFHRYSDTKKPREIPSETTIFPDQNEDVYYTSNEDSTSDDELYDY